MSSFGFGSGGFGSSNNNQQSTGFGGFGSNTGAGFGQPPQNTGFGGAASNTGGGLFGSGGSGFGASTTSGFGSKPAFGNTATTGGGLFGASTTASGTGFGGFGSNNTTSNAATPFGAAASSGGGLFGSASKPAFGTGSSTGGGLFGGGSTGTGFGQSNTQTGLFGAPQSTALGTVAGDCQGTGSTPFQAFTEKDAPNSSHTNHFQSISFMAPYNKFSFEELRLADYNQGRRYGNGSGQAGAFGTSTGFGGFGAQNTQNTGSGFGTSTGTGLFGAQPAASSSPFGTTTQTAGAFGSGTGGGLFGAAKPATGLFGTTPATTSTQSGGGLFGTSGQTGFGTQQGTGFVGTTTGGGLFGNNTQQPQKSGFSFGTGATSGTGTTGFGAAGGGTGLFGTSNQGNSAFGQQQTPATNPFGTQPAQTQSAFGGFGTTPQKSNLFGTNSTSTGGGLFGNVGQNNNQQSSNTNPFGGGTTQPAASSLFGAKPAATAGTGTGLFGNNPTNQNTSGLGGGGLFGSGFGGNNNNQNQQNQGNNLFGNSNNQQPGLFGNSGTGGGLFGNNNAQQSGGGLFGNTNSNQNQQPSGGGLFGNSASNNNSNGSSLFGNTQSNALQPPQAMTASIMDRNPYGSSSIFNGLPPPPQASPGPIATPISAGYKARKQAPLPQHKINPIMSSRYTTPQKRGYGFSYSTYGTPSSAMSNASTPGGLSSSLLGSSISRGLGRGLGKSLSAYNLRGTFDNDGDSILSPGAFSADSTRYSGHGSLKKLTIDRNLRTDLFGSQAVAALPSPDKSDQSRQPGILKKKVSFDTNTLGGNSSGANNENGDSEPAENSSSSATPSAQEQGFLRSSRGNSRPNGTRPNGVSAQSEMEQVKGNELAIVHEDGPPEPSNASSSQSRPRVDQTDPEPGNYYMKPSREELRKVSRDRLKKFPDFIIGREECGFVHFDQPVDLTTVDLDHIFDNIAVITTRSLTIYPHAASKPPLGHGLNVPATITLANSWPRGRDRKTPSFEKSGLKFSRHVDRLSKVAGTEFVKYDKDTGEWVFKVPHFTTYALDFDDNGSEGDSLQTGVLSEAPDTPTPRSRTPKSRYTPMPTQSVQESSMLSEQSSQFSSGVDDTFEFKKKRLFPGAFDDAPVFDNDQEMQEIENNGESFLGERSVASPYENGDGEPSEFNEDAESVADNSLVIPDNEIDMVGSYPQPDVDDDAEGLFPTESIFKPKSILKVNQPLIPASVGTPGKTLDVGGDWAEQLQQTVSPKKQDRFTLRESQANLDNEYEFDHSETPKVGTSLRGGAGLVTSIDLMNSLFGQDERRNTNRRVKQGAKGKDFEWPYHKKSKTHASNESEMTEADQAFHESYKPNWGPANTLLYAISGNTGMTHDRSVQTSSILRGTKNVLVSEGRDIRVTKFAITANMIPENLSTQRAWTKIAIDQGVPYAIAQPVPFQLLAEGVSYNAANESSVWELAGILFDDFDDEISESVPATQRVAFEHRIRKDRLTHFWTNLCTKKGQAAVTSAPTAEERAIAHLSMHRVAEACDVLVEGKDFRLATLVAQIGGDQIMREDMTNQLEEWRRLNVLSEMTEPIRALYELLSGNSCVCEGKKGPIEDRAKTFLISSLFNLDWRRAFGLRLWYSILEEEPIEAAVQRFALDLERGENRKPVPPFVENDVNQGDFMADKEDVLWGLLKLYAESKNNGNTTKLAAVVMPQNLTDNPVDTRFSFQLYNALKTRFPSKTESYKADRINVDFATQLDSGGEWLWAAFVLLHISHSNERQKALQCLIARHAADIEGSGSQSFQTLVDEFRIPDAWIWEAKALYARSVSQNPVEEVDYLLRAKDWNEAHNTLCRVVAPRAIVEQDYSTLQHLLDNFGGREKVSDWGLGGQVYEDYLQLIKGPSNDEKARLLGRLLTALPIMVKDHSGRLGFTELVAVQEMSATVGLAVLEDKKNTAEGLRIMQLPQTENSYLKHTQDLSLQYYKTLMAGGK